MAKDLKKATGLPISYTVTPRMLTLLEEISELRTTIEQSRVIVPWIPQLGNDAATRIAHASTAIEGNPLTLKEVKIISNGGDVPTRSQKQQQEILNYLEALRFVVKHAKKLPTQSDLLKLHSILAKGYTLDLGPFGEFRDEPIAVGKHLPPKAHEVPSLIAAMLAWLNKEGKQLPPIIVSAIIHYVFEYIHPFMDGNGRVGRVLAAWILYQRTFDRYHIFSVDEVYLQNRDRYYKELQKVDQANGDLTTWIEYVGEAVLVTLKKLEKRISAIHVVKELNISLTPKQEKLLSLIKENPMNVRDIMQELKVSKPGAYYLLRPLLDSGLVEKAGGYKTGKYRLVSAVG
jgi:Fic family protein